MEHAVAAPPPALLPLSSTARTFTLHLISLVLPLSLLGFVATAPHHAVVALPWLALIPLVVLLDKHGGVALHRPIEGMPAWPFDALLVVLALVQLAIVALFARLVAVSGLLSADALVGTVLVGANSGYSAIVVAHELIHRRSRPMILLGRLLLATVLYEHFFTEHVRGHHARVGTDEDAASARFGESYKAFFRRTVPAQLRSAWRLEAKRLGDEDMRWHDPRLLRSAVVHGIALEASMAALVLALLGPLAFAAHLVQASMAIRLLEAVNWFEHYGLRRQGRRVRPVDSWDSDSAYTLFALVGLSRHADHHAYASRPFQALRTWEESPKLPHGYIVTTLLTIFANDRLRGLLAAELERKKLGPFAEA